MQTEEGSPMQKAMPAEFPGQALACNNIEGIETSLEVNPKDPSEERIEADENGKKKQPLN